ncbi:hypothetical protein BC835DRAFT_1411146 [Cytidiella melzeri]|nr:hypothetical protein BC835DRAFT_1411146 [Cytidiella melzeri]
MSSYTHVPFVSLHRQPGLVSLDAARSNPEIKYRSVNLMFPSPPSPVTSSVRSLSPSVAPVPALKSSIPLVPLSVAQAQADIKYRREGFEMQEHRRHILAVRADFF